jgi:hypothetical protein
MKDEWIERWLAPQLGRVHAELQARYGFGQKPERGAADAAARGYEGQPPAGERERLYGVKQRRKP